MTSSTIDVGQVLSTKTSGTVATVSPDVSLQDLLDLLVHHDVGALVVSRDGETVLGIVSERDVIRRLQVGRAVLGLQVAAVMTEAVHTCELSTPLEQAARLMTVHRVRHLPVMEDGKLAGIVSMGDVVAHWLDNRFDADV
ncbi:CBS domain-containing protein [Nocardioides yefusunii]|uniref:CBS domain-containing protein n=1 Tax=Nocardioides yefusunii TaxID=2500546 RepID=A0ABW1QWA2_9ACTN|nr:CBS domain-containing protein [Nocardioides yefusunii]